MFGTGSLWCLRLSIGIFETNESNICGNISALFVYDVTFDGKNCGR